MPLGMSSIDALKRNNDSLTISRVFVPLSLPARSREGSAKHTHTSNKEKVLTKKQPNPNAIILVALLPSTKIEVTTHPSNDNKNERAGEITTVFRALVSFFHACERGRQKCERVWGKASAYENLG